MIRSFVLRQGRMTKGQARALDVHWATYGVDVDGQLIDLEALFGNRNPVTLEVGFGMDDSLASQAASARCRNFLGVEVHRPGVGHLLLRAEELGLRNLKIIRDDAVQVLGCVIPPASLDALQIFFPDPWPKKRHQKRRLIQKSFLDLAAGRLQAGGLLHVATDWTPYAQEMRALFQAHPDFEMVGPPGRAETGFEKRGRKLGHLITDLACRRR